jgi:L-lactate utilization protein LutC
MVTIIKQSGSPVGTGEEEKFKTEWKEGFDKLFEADGDMPVITEKAQALENELMEKYEIERSIELPKSIKAWKELLEESKGSIMVDVHKDTGKLILIILDLGF